MVVLEAMSVKTSVLVNGKCPVLKAHCRKSNGALYYMDYYEFEGCVNYILAHLEEVEQMKENAKNYVEENYNWDTITGSLFHLINYVKGKKE